MPIGAVLVALFLCAAISVSPTLAQPTGSPLPPALGPEEPKVEPLKGEDGIYTQTWYMQSFLDLKDDLNEAHAAGKRFAVIFEQKGCIYCTKMHTEVLALKYVNDYVRENFRILQIDLWGAREVTDFDGHKVTEKLLAERWGVLFTPTIVFFKDDLTGLVGKWGAPLEVARMQLGIGAGTFYDMFVWVRHQVYEQDRNFQRFHIQRYNEREALARAAGKSSSD